ADMNGGIGEPVTITIAGFVSFGAHTMAHAAREILFGSVALGVTASVAWWEAHVDGPRLGRYAGFYASLCVMGAIFGLVLYFAVGQIDGNAIGANDIKYIEGAYYLLIGSILSYFLCILQVRRIRDVGGL